MSDTPVLVGEEIEVKLTLKAQCGATRPRPAISRGSGWR
jgi:hypothetical protein